MCGGCMMEGVASEAASLAGTLGLGKLIVLYDRNKITIEGSTDIAMCEDVGARFAAYGWQVQDIADGEDIDAIDDALQIAKAETKKPSLIIVHTKIAHGTAKEGLPSAHGEPLGAENIAAMKESVNWEGKYPFDVPTDVYRHFGTVMPVLANYERKWNELFEKYRAEYPELAAQWDAWHAREMQIDLVNDEAFWKFDGKMATRAASGEVLNRLAARLPNLFGGSADLAPSNKTNLKNKGDFSAADYAGDNIHFGVREFAMAAACNGIALYGGLKVFCATFFVFSDYLKPALRMSALMKLPILYVLTHDSIGVGEDGPTHQPIEQLAALRATPNTIVFRPADAKETAAGYVAALHADGPTALVLSRQNLPLYEETGANAMKGGYILKDCAGTPDVLLMASGSEVELIYKAAEALKEEGIAARVVSMPSFELFEAQDAAYKESVLPKSVRARVAVEAAASFGWDRYTGLDGAIIAHDGFGASAPAGKLFEAYGFTAENVVAAAKRVLGK